MALKVLKTPSGYDEAQRRDFLAAFSAEAKTLARIAHPAIVLVHDFGVSVMPSGGEAAWMALEWLTGETLRDDLRRRRGEGGRDPAACLELVRPLLSALALVHAAGVAHRDLKPENVMLVPGPLGVVPKLVDFGISKLMTPGEVSGTGHTHTRSHDAVFSPAYASPEQISFSRTGPWTDVHAMGLLLTELLTDQPPFGGADTTALFQQILDPVRPTPAKLGVDVGAWEPVIAKAVAISPSDRFDDAAALLQALESALPPASLSLGSALALAATEQASLMPPPKMPDRVAGPVPSDAPLAPVHDRTEGVLETMRLEQELLAIDLRWSAAHRDQLARKAADPTQSSRDVTIARWFLGTLGSVTLVGGAIASVVFHAWLPALLGLALALLTYAGVRLGDRTRREQLLDWREHQTRRAELESAIDRARTKSELLAPPRARD